jgi:hypothetical protein
MTLTGRPGGDGHGDGAVPIRLSALSGSPRLYVPVSPIPPFAKEPCRSHFVHAGKVGAGAHGGGRG